MSGQLERLRLARFGRQFGRVGVVVQQQVADRQRLAVDGRRRPARDRQVDDVVDVGLVDRHLLVLQLDVDAADGSEVGVVAEHLDAAQLGHEVGERAAQGLALARQQDVDDPQRVLGLDGRQQRLAGGLGRVGAAIVVTTGDPGDGEHARAEEGDHTDDRRGDGAAGPATWLVGRGGQRAPWSSRAAPPLDRSSGTAPSGRPAGRTRPAAPGPRAAAEVIRRAVVPSCRCCPR